jgi:putative aminopeptidase FrvX
MLEELSEMLARLCAAPGVSGNEEDAAKAAAAEFEPYAAVSGDTLGSMTARMGSPDAEKRILLDAHIDQIGLIVTGIGKSGFLHVDSCGGADCRVLPGTPVTVYGTEPVCGVVCCTPPHLAQSGDEEKVEAVDRMSVDIGLSRKEAEKLVHPGDRVLFAAEPRALLGTRFTSPGLDNRASVAALARCAQLLSGEDLKCSVSFQCSTREEVGGQGAKTAAFTADPTQAIVVDVSFAVQPGVQPEKSHPLGGGPMIGFAPILNRNMSRTLVSLAEKRNMPYKYDVMGNSTGTNADTVAVTRTGVETGLISIPLKNMHTNAEIVDLRDIENTAQLLAQYIREAE